jgi:RNA polymerase sigma-70 factor (sigma-E family)
MAEGHAAQDVQFAEFVKARGGSLFRTAFLLTSNTHGAEELVQDTLALLYPKWDRAAQADAPLAYVRRALVNRFVSGQRRPAARDIAMWELPDRPDPAADQAGLVTDRMLLWQLLATLPQRQRAALVMRYFHDLPDDEIAAALGCRHATVRSLISRGVAAMRDRSEPAFSAHHSPNGEPS